MSPPVPPDPKEIFRQWFRRELWLETRVALVFLAAGCTAVLGLDTLWSGFGPYWHRLNYQLTYVALEQHPVALIRTFANRLGDSEYGWGVFSFAEPMNVTSARERLRQDYREIYGVGPDGTPQFLRTSSLKRADPAMQKLRALGYRTRHQQIESHRFTRLYQPDDPFNPTDSGTKLARLITKIFGLPDAFIHTLRSIVATGLSGIILFSTVLALSAVALLQSHRPARWWLKLLVWPTLASALIWLAIAVMSLSAACFGGLTPNTSALALFTVLPFLFLAAKLPLRYAESLVHVTPPAKPAKWDGVERRKPRPPEPKPGETIPPIGGA
ncbi:MAG: hypothetical protein HYV75_07710 [Opitutae bacterium]|nr:hypothetical protein [Opitutae bacterium]